MAELFRPQMQKQEVDAISALGLAHIGDAVYELLVRTELCESGRIRARNMHALTVSLVSAKAQSAAAAKLLPLLTEEESSYFHRGRNAHPHMIPKHSSPAEYARATGVEALFGALYLLGRTERITELFAAVLEEDHAV